MCLPLQGYARLLNIAEQPIAFQADRESVILRGRLQEFIVPGSLESAATDTVERCYFHSLSA